MKRFESLGRNGMAVLIAGATLVWGGLCLTWTHAMAQEKEGEASSSLIEGLDGGEYEPYKTSVIVEVQQALRELGRYSGEVSGKLDTATMQAIQEFQEEHGIHPSGVPSPRTRSHLFSKETQAAANAARDEVRNEKTPEQGTAGQEEAQGTEPEGSSGSEGF